MDRREKPFTVEEAARLFPIGQRRRYLTIAEGTNRRGATLRAGDRIRWRGRLRRIYRGEVREVRVRSDDAVVLWVSVDGSTQGMEIPIDKAVAE